MSLAKKKNSKCSKVLILGNPSNLCLGILCTILVSFKSNIMSK